MFHFRAKHGTKSFTRQNIWRLQECYLPYSYFWFVITTVPGITLLYKAIATDSSVISDFSNLTHLFICQDLLKLTFYLCIKVCEFYREWFK